MGTTPAIPSTIVIQEDRHEVRLALFEGPLDLLLHLIRKQEIDIYDIPIALITHQYLQYLEAMKDLNVNVAGEFLEMAATLIYIKSRMLLPPDPEAEGEALAEEDPRRELVERLLEYETFKNIAQTLYTRQELEAGMWNVSRLGEVVTEGEEILAVSLYDLMVAFRNVLKRMEDRKTLEMDREEITVAEMISRVREILKKRRRVMFSQFLQAGATRLQMVVLFVAVLEMMRMKLVRAQQVSDFSDIAIIRRRPVRPRKPPAAGPSEKEPGPEHQMSENPEREPEG